MTKKLRPYLTCLTFLFLMLLPMIALAQGDGSGSAEEVHGTTRAAFDIVEVIAFAVGTLVVLLVGKLIHTLEKKFKVDVPDAWEVKLNDLLDKGIHYAEEQARKQVKKGTQKLDSNETLAHAVDFVLDMSNDKKLVEMGKEKVKKLIEARLNEKRQEDALAAAALAPVPAMTGKPDGVSGVAESKAEVAK